MKGTITFLTLSFAIESVSNKTEALWAATVLPSTKAFIRCPPAQAASEHLPRQNGTDPFTLTVK